MEKKTVFIKRYPSKGELPKKEGFYLTNKGKLHTDNFKSWFVEYWLEEIELPSEVEILSKASNENADTPDFYGGYFDGYTACWRHIKSTLK